MDGFLFTTVAGRRHEEWFLVLAVRVAAYQAPLLPSGSTDALRLIRARVAQCEAAGVDVLCCPEAILGGLADHAAVPAAIAIDGRSGALATMLAPLASETVTTIIGFTESGEAGLLFNSAAIFERGVVTGIYRKVHPAIRKSVYAPGCEAPVFRIGSLSFGVLICYDSTFPELARVMAGKGATVLFIPTNNALRPEQGDASHDARHLDIAMARANGVAVVRADVAGRADGLISYGSSEIVSSDGSVLCAATRLKEDLLIAELVQPG